jgi:hypothetical protein
MWDIRLVIASRKRLVIPIEPVRSEGLSASNLIDADPIVEEMLNLLDGRRKIISESQIGLDQRSSGRRSNDSFNSSEEKLWFSWLLTGGFDLRSEFDIERIYSQDPFNPAKQPRSIQQCETVEIHSTVDAYRQPGQPWS